MPSIENMFGQGKRVILVSLKAKKYLPYVIENNLETEFELGESFLIEKCHDLNKNRCYYLKLFGIELAAEKFGFERLFPANWFSPPDAAHAVLRAMGCQFDRDNKIIKTW